MSLVLYVPHGVNEKTDHELMGELQKDGFPCANQARAESTGPNRALVADGVKDGSEPSEHIPNEEPDLGGVWGAAVVRQIFPSDPEYKSEGACRALDAELKKLLDKQTWDPEEVMELRDLKKHGKYKEALVGRVFAILGEKHAEEQREEKAYKARIVFQGNRITSISGTPAHELFKQLSNSPVTMSSARTAMAVGLLKGRRVQLRDASQAYLQSWINTPEHTPTFIFCPESGGPKIGLMNGAIPYMTIPSAVSPRHCTGTRSRSLHWRPVEGHASTWVKSLPNGLGVASLVIYVDDMMMCAPDSECKRLWTEIDTRVEFRDPPEDVAKYLGAGHNISVVDGSIHMEVEMHDYLRCAIERFKSEYQRELRQVSTPYVSDDEWCGSEGDDEGKSPERGVFSKTASSHVATLLYLARMCRPDALTAITRLARYVTRWEVAHDRAFFRLFSYLASSIDYTLQFDLDEGEDVIVQTWSDADLCGDPTDTKSTSGMWIELKGIKSGKCWPIGWGSKRQGCTAYSTCESEVIAMGTALREEGIPVQHLASVLTQAHVELECLEDNTQAKGAIERGYSKKLRHLPRVHRLSIGSMHELLCGEGAVGKILYHPTATHKADIFTKSMDRTRFQACREMIKVDMPKALGRRVEGGVNQNSVSALCCNSCDDCLCMD
eukprot:6492506-Amphidinium_carterae.1